MTAIVAWLAFVIAVLVLALLTSFVVGLALLWRRHAPTIAPYISMFTGAGAPVTAGDKGPTGPTSSASETSGQPLGDVPGGSV